MGWAAFFTRAPRGNRRALSSLWHRAGRLVLAALAAIFTVAPAIAVATGGTASALSGNFFDYQNHDVATSAAGFVDWGNNGALTAPGGTGSTWTRAGSQGIFNGGVYNGSTKPPTPPALTATGTALTNSGAIQSAAFVADPLSSDSFPCNGSTVSGDPTTFAGAGSETNNGLLSTFTYGTSGNTPPKDEISNAYAIAHNAGAAHEIFFGGERVVNNGASHIDFEFLQAKLAIPNPCGAGTMTGHRTQRDLLLSTDFTNGGAINNVDLYSWSCNGIAPGAAGYDASKDFTVCDPGASGNPHSGDPQYVKLANFAGIASFGVNTGANGISCGGWVCRNGAGAGTSTLLQNTLMEGGIDLAAAGFSGCINTFLPHTRTSPSFTSVLKDFAGPIAFSNCKSPTVTTSQSAGGATGANVTATVPTSVTDTATLHGAASTVKGSVTYTLYSDASCTQAVATSIKTINGTTDANGDLVLPSSNAVAVNAAGTYYWTAAYSGDTNLGGQNNAALSACGSEVLTALMPPPALSIVKTADAAQVSAGDSIGFTITAHNAGQGPATNASILDPLPGGPGVSWSISPAYAGPGTCSVTGTAPVQSLACNLGSFAPGASASVHVTSATTFASCATYENSATVAASNNPTVAPATASVTVECPGLSLTKTADAPAVNAGQSIGFTITVHNGGDGTAKSVTLTDPLPTGAGITWSIDPANGACGIANNTLSCSFGDLASGASASVHVTSPTVFASCGSYLNTAVAHATNTPAVEGSATTNVLCPGLQITKTADAPAVSAGDLIGFTVKVSNAGAGTATGVTLHDPLPTGTGVSWSIDPAVAGCAVAGTPQTLDCSLGDFAPGASVTVHVMSATAAASCGFYPNTATAAATNHPAVQASDATVVNCPNVTINKTADAPVVDAGAGIGFSITVGNSGAGVAKNVTLTDPLPAGNGIDWAIDPAYAGPGSCTIDGAVGAQTLHCGFGDFAQGDTTTVHVASSTAFVSCAQYTNVATASATNGDAKNATASTTVQCPALQLTKQADDEVVNAGSAIGFTLTVSNAGPGTANDVTVTDPLPTGAGIAWSIDPATEGCAIAGGALSCAIGNLGADDSVSVHITSSTTFASCAAYPNNASAAAANHPEVHAQATTTVQCPDLSITKTADAPSVNTGDAIGFTVTVSNAGPGTAVGVVLDDPLPGGNGVDWSIDPANEACHIDGSAPSQTLECAFGDLGSETSVSVHVTSATTAASGGTYDNTATASADNAPSVDASATVVVLPPALKITKVADDPQVNGGQKIGFTVAVSNSDADGTGIARSVTLADPLPGGSDVAWSIDPTYSGPGTCSVTGTAPTQTLDCSFGDMAPGDSTSVHVASATTNKSIGTYDNTAVASTTNGDPVHASASTSVIATSPVTAESVPPTTTPPTTVAPVPAESLPFTGAEAARLSFIAVVLMATGTALVLGRRRRGRRD